MTAQLAVDTHDLTKTYRGDARDDWQRSLRQVALDKLRGLRKAPERKVVVDSVSLSVRRGEFFGVIGSNGAGKTTLLKLLCCLLLPDGGGGRVNGYDLRRQRTDVRRSVVIAKAGGWLGTIAELTGRENLLFRGRMCGLSRREAAERADYVMERLGISHKAQERSWHWSAGEQQRFGLALTFVARTPLVMLDEPTSHLDPHAARMTREFVREELNRRNGQTVIMSTHYLEEADMLCDRVAILHAGRVAACDTPAGLRRAYAPERILELRVTRYTSEVGARVRHSLGLSELLEQYEDVATGQARLRPKWPADAPPDTEALRARLEAEGAAVLSIGFARPTMDDVYFSATREKLS